MDNRDVQVLLDRTTLGEFVNTASAYRRGKKANVIVLEKNATLGDAMKVLAQHGVLSAPVLENRTREYIGFVDVRDILRGIIQAMYPELLEAEYVEKHSHLSSSELQTIAPDALLQPVSKLLHDNDLWFKGDNKSSLLKVVSQGFHIRPMASPSSSSASLREPKVAHRIAVFDVVPDEATPDGPTLAWQVQHIISQSDVLHFIATHMDHLGPIFQAPIKDLGIGTEGVRTVSAGTPALAAFAIMHHTGSSGLGLVKEEGGPLVGNLSMSDLRGLTMERFSALSLPAGEYVLLQNGVGLSWDDVLFGKRPEGAAEGEWDVVLQDVPLVTCTLESTVAEVIRSVLDAQIHRIYVMDADRRPIGIITLTDLPAPAHRVKKGEMIKGFNEGEMIKGFEEGEMIKGFEGGVDQGRWIRGLEEGSWSRDLKGAMDQGILGTSKQLDGDGSGYVNLTDLLQLLAYNL